MKVALDACVPAPFRHSINGHEVVTAHFLGLGNADDADLLGAIEGTWDVLVTCDRGIPWQHQFSGRLIAVIVLRAPSNKLQDLVKLVPSLHIELDRIQTGEVREIWL